MPLPLTFPVPFVEPDELTPLPPVLTLLEDSTGAVAFTGEWSADRLSSGVRRGDEAAVRALHSQYCQRLTRYALVITRGDEAAAAEAVQSSFLKALRSLRHTRCHEALWAWLARAARTSAADAGRSRRRYSALLSRAAALFTRDTEPLEDTEAVWHEALEAALTQLDPASRALIEARYFQRVSLAEVADTEHTSVRAIEGRLARVREKLRSSILQTLATRSHET